MGKGKHLAQLHALVVEWREGSPPARQRLRGLRPQRARHLQPQGMICQRSFEQQSSVACNLF